MRQPVPGGSALSRQIAAAASRLQAGVTKLVNALMEKKKPRCEARLWMSCNRESTKASWPATTPARKLAGADYTP